MNIKDVEVCETSPVNTNKLEPSNEIQFKSKLKIPNILTADSWPSYMKKNTPYRPVDLLNAIYEYIETDRTLAQSLGEELFRIWKNILRKEKGLSLYLRELRREKAYVIIETAKEMYDIENLPSICFKKGLQGTELSAAGAQFIKNKSDFFVRYAKILEQGTISEKMKLSIEADVEHRHIHVDLKDALQMPLSKLTEQDTLI